MGAKQLSKCKTLNCKFNVYGRCKILRNTNFKKSCPFFSSKQPQYATADDLSKVTAKTD